MELATRPEHLREPRTITYDPQRWRLLAQLRARAVDVMSRLKAHGISSVVYGSVARGDVRPASDIDIVVLRPISSYRLEIALDPILRREIVQATPSMVLKGHIYLEDSVVVSFPLFKMRPREMEFYTWGGQLDLDGLREGKRVPGVDKHLLLIEPTDVGHVESSVLGHEAEVADLLGVSPDIAHERVRVLLRRDELGRTGVYLTRPVPPDSSFEAVVRMIEDRDPAVRRTIRRRR